MFFIFNKIVLSHLYIHDKYTILLDIVKTSNNLMSISSYA